MNANIEKIKIQMRAVECPSDLEEKILGKVRLSRIKRTQNRLCFFGLSVLVSLGAFAYMLTILISKLSTSGFYEYASIFLSDSKFAVSNWKETSATLLESAPLFEIGLLSILVALVLFLASKTTREASVYSNSRIKLA